MSRAGQKSEYDPGIPQLLGRGMAMGDQLARHARTIPDDVAFVHDATRITYRQLDERVSRLAGALHDRGVVMGDRVAVLGTNRLEVIESYFACTRLGAVCVPLNFRLVGEEIAYQLSDSGACAVITESSLHGSMVEALAKTSTVHTSLVFGGDTPDGSADYERALAAADATFTEREITMADPAFIMYTSGTTGRPKGAVLTHQNLLMHAFSSMASLGDAPDDQVWMAAAPLFHIAGLSGILPAVLRGGRIVLLPSGRFDPAETVALMEREQVSSCFMVPAQWQAICALPDLDRRDLSALRRATWGAAPASTSLLRAMIDSFPYAAVTTSFGQTECSPITTILHGEDSLRKIGSIGRPMLNVEVRVVDDDMNDVPRGEVGEIVYRSPMVMKEYWNKPQETADVFRGGWFHSGDLVRQDEDGYYYVVDRKKDMIISGGENIYCAEVEDALAAHPGVAEVAVIGVPDERWGESPMAVIAPLNPEQPPTTEDVDEWSLQWLARYKRPRNLVVVPALPRNPSGKVLKTELRSRYANGELSTQPI